jgi:hypothetical protein
VALGGFDGDLVAESLETLDGAAECCPPVAHIIPQLGQIPLPHLCASHIVAAQRHWLTAGRLAPAARRGTPLSPRTVLHHHRVLHEALAQAVRWGDLARNPIEAVDPRRVDRHEGRARWTNRGRTAG